MIITPLQFNKTRLTKTNKKQITYNTLASEKTLSYGNIIPYQKPKIRSIYEDYDTAQKIFRKNLNQDEGIFGSGANVDVLMQNDTIRRNVVTFFAQYSKEQIDEIDKKKVLSIDEARYRADLVEVNNFFSEYESLWPESELSVSKQNPQKMLAFAGNMSDKDERDCKNIVHTFSVACGLVSSAMGEGAAIGADTMILRPAQFTMFSIMALKLKVPPIPSMEYCLKEMCQGANLGVGGAKLATSWLGIAGHTAAGATGATVISGGSANAAITGGVRAVNGTLSTLITEKMGRGYIKRVKDNQMTLANQSIELGSYFLARRVFAHENPLKSLSNIDFKDASSPELIKDALMNMPKSYQKATSGLIGILAKNTVNVGELFLGNFALTYLASKEKDPEKLKEQASQIFRNCLIQSVSYELSNALVRDEISKEATEKIKHIQENLEKYPEVYRIVINKEHEFFEQINLETLKSDAFAKQFTNKTFVVNLSRLLRDAVREVEYAWVNKDTSKNLKAMQEAIKQAEAAKDKSKEIANSISPDEQKEYEKMLEEMKRVLSGQVNYLREYDNFGYGRIGGYEDIKEHLTQILISPLSLENSTIATKAPNSILLYGPTSVGKSQMAIMAAEQGKCKLITIDDFNSVQDLQDRLDAIYNNAKNSKRHFIIKIDEFDEFSYDDESVDAFKNYIQKASENNVTFIFTSNDPLCIDKDILKQSINIPVAPAGKKDIVGVLKHYIRDLDEQDYQEIAQNIFDNSNNGAYSNAQIENMCYTAMTSGIENIKQKMIQLISTKKPEISQEDIKKFQSEIEVIGENNESNSIQQ